MWIILIGAVIAGVIALDQISKLLVLNFLYEKQIEIIPGVLNFTYVENRGMAFGMLSDHRWVFMVLSVLASWLIFKEKLLPINIIGCVTMCLALVGVAVF